MPDNLLPATLKYSIRSLLSSHAAPGTPGLGIGNLVASSTVISVSHELISLAVVVEPEPSDNTLRYSSPPNKSWCTMYSVLTAATPLVIVTLPAVVIILLVTLANGISKVLLVTFEIVNEAFNIVLPSSFNVTTNRHK